jgi:hypothetical protein
LLVLIAIHLPTLLINLSNPTQSGLVFDYNISKFHWKKKFKLTRNRTPFLGHFCRDKFLKIKNGRRCDRTINTRTCVWVRVHFIVVAGAERETMNYTTGRATRKLGGLVLPQSVIIVLTSQRRISNSARSKPLDPQTRETASSQTGPGVAKFVISASNTSLLLKCGKQQRTPARLFLNGKKTRRFWQKQTRLKQQQIVTMGVTTIDGTCSYFG